ncbi:transcription factor Adf-1-like [Cydia strobilella]|uniref:transcription factor Adf-1-like n=1 Tax=Cydia strobilella TaxID=1100964 RepID=UPI003004F34E
MADSENENTQSRDSTPEPEPEPIPHESKYKHRYGPQFRIGLADAALIEYVRDHPVIFDPSHLRYMDTNFKQGLWVKIGRQLKVNPSSCKARWNNIRDQYRKTLRKRKSKIQYKFAHLMGFMDPIYKGQFDPSPSQAVNISSKTEHSDDSNDIQKSQNPEESQIKSPNHDDQSEADALSNQSESVVDYEMFEKSSVPPRPAPQAVDEFFAAIGPTLKALSPYHLSLAKAEIFAVVHKYELKGIVQGGWASPNVNPLP